MISSLHKRELVLHRLGIMPELSSLQAATLVDDDALG
jgi:hypothetical protein